MIILLINPENDPAGATWNLYKALKKYTNHEVYHIVGIPTFIHQTQINFVKDCDIILGGNLKNYEYDKLEYLVNKADILHFSQWDWTRQVLGGTNGLNGIPFSFKDIMHRKDQKLFFQGHGGAWLLDPDERMTMYKKYNCKVITCSPIDEKVIPEAEWMPNILGLDYFDFSPDWSRDFNGKLIASLANVCPVYKGGEIVEYIFEYLNKFGYEIEFSIIKNLVKEDCIKLRKKHHITIDNWTQGFTGFAGIEGLALGHIVFARLDPLAIKNWYKKFEVLPPFENIIGMDECAKEIRYYYNNRELMKHKCWTNRKWIDRYYTDEKIIKIWEELYEE
jgi:hypothetical protein